MNKLTKLFAFVLAITTAAAAHAQVTGTSLPNKTTLTSGNVTTTSPFVYTDGVGLGVRKVTIPGLMDFGGWGPLDTGVLAGLQLNGTLTGTGNLSIAGTSVLAGTVTLSGGLISTSATISGTLGVLGRLSVGTATATNFITLYNPTTNSDLIASIDGTSFSSGTRFRGIRFFNNGTEKGALQYKYSTGTETMEIGSQGTIGFGIYVNGAYRTWITPTDGYVGISTTAANSSFHVAGSIASSLRATTTNGNITTTDYVVTGTGAITLTLPTAVGITGREYVIKNIGAVTLTAGSAGGTIDAATTQAIISGAGSGSSLRFKSDGTNWIIIQ
jgi:cytoskeletal protein CcmA (bactofilin family)